MKRALSWSGVERVAASRQVRRSEKPGGPMPSGLPTPGIFPARHRPSGFTLMESGAAMAILSVALLMVAQLGYWSYKERARSAAHFAALEHTSNILEEAWAMPWEQLDAAWANAQTVPEFLDSVLPDAKLAVKVEQSAPYLKHVTVELAWNRQEGVQSRPIRVETWIGSRPERSRQKQGEGA